MEDLFANSVSDLRHRSAHNANVIAQGQYHLRSADVTSEILKSQKIYLLNLRKNSVWEN